MADDNRFALQKSTRVGSDLTPQGEMVTGSGLASVKSVSPPMKPKPRMFGRVAPYNFRADYSLTAIYYFNKMDIRVLIACSVCGINPVYWAELNLALEKGVKPFNTWFRRRSKLTWIDIGKLIIPFVAEAYYPPLYPKWLERSGYNQEMYLSYLTDFWDDMGAEYREEWGTGQGWHELSATDSVLHLCSWFNPTYGNQFNESEFLLSWGFGFDGVTFFSKLPW